MENYISFQFIIAAYLPRRDEDDCALSEEIGMRSFQSPKALRIQGSMQPATVSPTAMLTFPMMLRFDTYTYSRAVQSLGVN